MHESDRELTLVDGESPDDPIFWEPSVRFLKFAIAFTLIGALACVIVLLVLVPEQKMRLLLALLWLPVGLLAWFFIARDRIRPTVAVLCIGVWAQVTLALFVGGVGSTILVVYPLVVLFSGWMIGPRFTLVLAALTIALLLFVAAREASGVPYSLGATTPPLVRGFILGSVVAVTTLLIAHLLRAYRRRLAERKDSEEALRESEARFRSLVALSSDWYWEQDRDFRFVSMSDGESDLGGIRAIVRMGLRRWELPGTEIIGQTWEAHKATLLAHEPFRELRLRRIGEGGEVRYVNVSGEPVFDRTGAFTGYRGIARDVTERVRAGHLARAADERLKLAIEHLDEAISITDGDDRIVMGNRSFRELNRNTRPLESGHTYEQHLRAGMAVGNYPESAGREEAWLAERLRRRQAGGTLVVKRQDGRWLQVSDQRLQSGGIITFSLDITASKVAEFALRKSEQRFRDFAEAGLDWFWETDADGRYTWVSDSIERVGGGKPEWYVGKTRFDLAARSDDLSAEPWKSHLESLEQREPFRGFRYECAGPNGNNWLSVSGIPYHDESGAFAGYRGAGTDLTAIVNAEKQANATREVMRVALENLGEMICLTDADDRIVMVNRKFVDFNEAVAEFLVPGRLYEEHFRAGIPLGLFPDAVGKNEDWVAERMAHRRVSTGSFERRRQDGRWLLVSDQTLPDGNIITYCIEITERKRAEEALQNINADLERRVTERTAQLEATYRELESFSYAVSHDLRAPLRAVTGFSTLLLEGEGEKLSAEGRRHLGIIDANARRMAKLIDALLALGRYTRVDLNRTEVDMERLAREACDELAPTAPRARIVVGALPSALGNATLLKQVFLNLVGNALKYSANAAEPRVEIRAEGDRYLVSDNGAGFDMAYVGKLFQPFERLHTDLEFEGTGIGLAIVKLIVERHGGRVEARGTPGEGAMFSYTLGAVV